MKNPTFPETVLYPTYADIDRFLRRYAGRIDPHDKNVIYETAGKLVNWYKQSDTDRERYPQGPQMQTREAKNIIYMETNLDTTMRRELATIFDSLAVRGGQRRWTFPTDKHGNLIIKMHQCYV